MKKNVAVALAGVLIVAVAGGWWSMSGNKSDTKTAKARPPPAAPRQWRRARAGDAGHGEQKQDVPVTVQVNGSVVSLNSVDCARR
jgi:multidrug efflux system membrane fusion protein